MDTTRTITGLHRLAWMHPLLTLLVSVLALLALTALVNHSLRWGQRTLDDVRYGVPRRVVVSGVVGHGDSEVLPTRFLALNLDGQVSVRAFKRHHLTSGVSMIRSLPRLNA